MVKDFMFDPHGPAPYILVVLVFLISLAYAGVNEKLHQSRQQVSTTQTQPVTQPHTTQYTRTPMRCE